MHPPRRELHLVIRVHPVAKSDANSHDNAGTESNAVDNTNAGTHTGTDRWFMPWCLEEVRWKDMVRCDVLRGGVHLHLQESLLFAVQTEFLAHAYLGTYSGTCPGTYPGPGPGTYPVTCPSTYPGTHPGDLISNSNASYTGTYADVVQWCLGTVRWTDLVRCDVLCGGVHLLLPEPSLFPVHTTCFAYAYWDPDAYTYNAGTYCNDPGAREPFANSGNSDPSALTDRVKQVDHRDLDHRLLGLLQAELLLERQGQRHQADALV
mmetsp:Transcript_85499/g.183290  ORF Transcript_85499/g.183290 Transcript_85499/m.183290 type:complete len:263 (+) Transcript_85499:885-1673(+)